MFHALGRADREWFIAGQCGVRPMCHDLMPWVLQGTVYGPSFAGMWGIIPSILVWLPWAHANPLSPGNGTADWATANSLVDGDSEDASYPGVLRAWKFTFLTGWLMQRALNICSQPTLFSVLNQAHLMSIGPRCFRL